jgi:Bbp16-like protein
MFIDAALLFDNGIQHLTTEAGTDYIDLGAVRNIGVGEDLYFFAVVTVAFTDASSNSTMALTLETDDASTFGSPTTVQTIGTFAALSAIGTRLVAKLQPDAILERFLRLKYTVANGDLSTGKFTAGITKDIQAYTSYADNITIS